MAFVSNNSQQLSLMDSTFNLTERERKFLEKSWAKAFADKIFPAINEELFSVLYSSKASRPNTPVNVIVGALILKEALGDSDDELVEALMFDIRYQYALHTTSFEEQPLSDRTLSRFRARCLAYETETGIDLIHMCVISLAKEIAEFMKLTPSMQRMGEYPNYWACSHFLLSQVLNSGLYNTYLQNTTNSFKNADTLLLLTLNNIFFTMITVPSASFQHSPSPPPVRPAPLLFQTFQSPPDIFHLSHEYKYQSLYCNAGVP